MKNRGMIAGVAVALVVLPAIAEALDGDICVERFNSAGILYNEAQMSAHDKPRAFLEAAKAFESFIERAKDCPDKEKCEAKDKLSDGYFYLGASWCEGGKPAGAITPLSTLVRQFPTFPHADKAIYFLGKAQYDTGDHAAAATTFAGIAKYPKSDLADVILYWEGESRYRVAESIAKRSGDAKPAYDEAIALFRKLQETFPSSKRGSDALYSMGWCYLNTSRWKEAMETFLKLTTDRRYKEEACFRCAECAYALTDYAKTTEYYDQTIKINGPFAGRAMLGKGWALFKQSRFGEAAGAFEQTLASMEKSSSPDDRRRADEARLALGESLTRAGNDPKGLQRAVEVLTPLMERKEDISDDASYLIALAQDRNGATDDARKTLATAVERFPEGNMIVDLRLLQGDVAYAAAAKATDAKGALEEACQAYEAVIGNPAGAHRHAAAYQKLIVVLYTRQKYADAVAKCEEFRRKFAGHPLLPMVTFAQAESHFALKEIAEATKRYQETIETDKERKNVPNALYRLAFIARDERKFDKAVETFARIATEFPQHALAKESAYLAAVTLLDAGKFPEAYTRFSDFAKKYPNEGSDTLHAKINAGVCLSRQKKLKEAQGELEQAYSALLVKEQPRNRRQAAAVFPDPAPEGADMLLYELAWVCAELKDDAGVNRYYDLLLGKQFEKSPYRADALFAAADVAYDKQEHDGALAKYRQIADILSQRAAEAKSKHDLELEENTLYRIGWCLFKKGEYAEAQKAFDRLVERFPEGRFASEACFVAGESAMRNPAFAGEKAREYFRKVIERYPADKLSLEKSLFRLGDCLARMSLWEESLRTYEEFLNRFPKSGERASALYGIGLAHQKMGKIEQAVETFEKAKTEDGGRTEVSPKSQFMIAEILFQQKKYEEALTALKLVWMRYANAEWSSRALYEAGKVAKELKQWKEAVAFLERLIKEFPSTPHAAEAKKEIDALRKLATPGK